MKTHSTLIVALAALSAVTVATAQRRADSRINGGNVEVRITEPSGIDTYTVFQGSGITGPIEIPITLGNCVTSKVISIGPLSVHNHQHTADWLDCTNVRRRWAFMPISGQWMAGTPLPVRSSFGFGCGMQNALGLDLDAAPTLGTNRTLTVSDVPATTTVVGVFLAFGQANPAYPLTALGLASAECYVFIDLASAMAVGVGPACCSSPTFPLALPAAPVLNGMTVHSQAVTLSPGQNPAGILTSNGLNLVLAQ